MVFLLLYIVLSLSLYALFPKLGVAGWKGLVPGYNFVIWCEKVGRDPKHALWLLFPIVNIFIYAGLAIDMVRSFRKMLFWHSVLAVVATPIFFIYLAFSKDEEYHGPILTEERAYSDKLKEARKKGNKRQIDKLQSNNPYKKSAIREWTESIIFAVFAAAFIRMFLIEAYVIPTSSMEGSLLVGDFLFVSKAHYGIRMPMTIAMIPLLHNRVPVVGGESYLEKPQLPYRRLPSLTSIERNDPIVFNWPVGDSVFLTDQRSWTADQARRDPMVANLTRNSQLITRPLDKKDHYIKRCIAMPGDSLQIINRQVHINGAAAENPEKMQFSYFVRSTSSSLNMRFLERIGVNLQDAFPGQSLYFLNEEQVNELKALGNDIIVSPVPQVPRGMFPYDTPISEGWTNDNYGPIYIPEKGATVNLSMETLPLYNRVISVYEGNDLEVRGDEIWINGQRADSYTFGQNYYWAMGDNRHNSEDSRVWGFVPEDHIVGKPLFIWFSIKNGNLFDGIRWNRIFTSANKF